MNFALRRRQNLRETLRWHAILLSSGAALLAVTVVPLVLGWWDVAFPAAIATAIFVLILLGVVTKAPLEAVAYVDIYTDKDPYSLPRPPKGFGRALYRLEALSLFESADPLHTKAPPVWHEPRDALRVVEELLRDSTAELRPHLEHLRGALELMSAKGARFYFLVKTWAGATNARVEALRHGDMSVIAPR